MAEQLPNSTQPWPISRIVDRNGEKYLEWHCANCDELLTGDASRDFGHECSFPSDGLAGLIKDSVAVQYE